MKQPRVGPTDVFITERIRAMCRDGIELVTPTIIAIASGEAANTNPQLQVRAFDTLAKHGLSKKPITLLETSEWFPAIAQVTARHLPDANAYEEWWKDIQELFDAAGN